LILHEDLHRGSLVAKEVIDLSEHQARNVPSAGVVDGASKPLVVRRALDSMIEEGAGVA
jgi:hypothetical protein